MQKLDVVVNSAAITRFDERLDRALEINTLVGVCWGGEGGRPAQATFDSQARCCPQPCSL